MIGRLLILVAALTVAFSARSENLIGGTWNGQLHVSASASLTFVIHLTSDDAGKPKVTVDSPDQGAFGIKGFVKHLSADSVRITIPKINASYAARLKDGKLIGTFKQVNHEFLLELTAGEQQLKRPQTPQAPFPYTSREVTFANPTADAVLAGTLTLPENYDKNTPIAIMVTGSGLQNRDEEIKGHKPFAVIADYLARRGVATLRYDDRGYGQSTGNPLTCKTTDNAQDAAMGIAYLRETEGFKNVGVIGHSEGATVAFILGAGRNEISKPSFLVAMGAPGVRGDSILADQSATALRTSKVDEAVIADYVNALYKYYGIVMTDGVAAADASIDTICAGMPATPIHNQMKTELHKITKAMTPWLEQFVSFSPIAMVKACPAPMFILYGSLDQQVRPDLNMPPMQAYAANAQIKLYPGLNHLFQHAETGDVQEYGLIEETISPEVLSDIADFILSNYKE